jgi:hypothetical protein
MLLENFQLNSFDKLNYIFRVDDQKEFLYYPMSMHNKYKIKINYIDNALIEKIFNLKNNPIAFIIVLDNIILLHRIRNDCLLSEKHLTNYLFTENEFLFQAIYMGASSRQGQHSCIYINEIGYIKRNLKIYISDKLDNIIENTVLDLEKTPAKLILETEIDFKNYDIKDFNNLLFEFDNFYLTFNFRQLYKFNNDIEISSIKLSKTL